jgi:hypothetical protein
VVTELEGVAMRRPTYSEAVSTLALFIALGGTSYAVTSLPAASVGTAQLRNGAVSASKLRAHAVDAAAVAANSLTGAQIDESSLGVVPHAALADTATSAKTAGTAKTATSATTADTATSATSATTADTASTAVTADNANLLGGASPATYKLSCPSGMVMTKDLCVELAMRTPDTWVDAEMICGLASRRLPSLGELAEALNALGAPQSSEWSSDVYVATVLEAIVMDDDASRSDGVSTAAATNILAFRCVSTPTNNG